METTDIKGRKILVVEDDYSSRLYLNKILEKAGVIVLNAVNGKEAVDLVAANSDLDLVLMDIQLPVMDGCTATSIIKKERPALKVIAQTAYALPEDKQQILNSGCDDYLVKPITMSALVSKVLEYLPAKKA